MQVATHDSIEDARTALLLYRKYLELKEAGTLQETLRDIYDKGNSLGFRPPQTAVGAVPASPTKSDFEGTREVPVNIPGSATLMRLMMRDGDVRGVRPISSSSDRPFQRGKRGSDRPREV